MLIPHRRLRFRRYGLRSRINGQKPTDSSVGMQKRNQNGMRYKYTTFCHYTTPETRQKLLIRPPICCHKSTTKALQTEQKKR
jgi:hypothetical protein